MTQPGDGLCFGYGSLANKDTHGFGIIGATRLKGFRRSWGHWVASETRNATSLTIVPSPNAEVLGVVMLVPAKDWTGLAKRETGYNRRPVSISPAADFDCSPDMVTSCCTYISRQDGRHDGEQPIYLSYIDTVAQGFAQIGGKDAVAEFFATTDGWDTPILNDRQQPIYPRATKLTSAETQSVDDALANLAVRWI